MQPNMPNGLDVKNAPIIIPGIKAPLPNFLTPRTLLQIAPITTNNEI